MSNLPQNKSGELETVKGGLQVKSLHDLPPPQKGEGGEILAIIGDISGSMCGRRETMLQNAITALWEITDWSLVETHCFAFDDVTEKVDFIAEMPPKMPGGRGSTAFRQAIQEALKIDGLNRIIFASDGGPTDCHGQDESLPWPEIRLCQERNIAIDTIFIDEDLNPDSRGAVILSRMSEETGGNFCLCGNEAELVSQFQQLETSNRLQLGYSGGQLEGPNVIKL